LISIKISATGGCCATAGDDAAADAATSSPHAHHNSTGRSSMPASHCRYHQERAITAQMSSHLALYRHIPSCRRLTTGLLTKSSSLFAYRHKFGSATLQSDEQSTPPLSNSRNFRLAPISIISATSFYSPHWRCNFSNSPVPESIVTHSTQCRTGHHGAGRQRR